MSAADTMQQTPAVPPRPTRSSDNNSSASMPLVPPRPASKRNDRSVSPNSARFAPSPFTEGIIAKPPKGSPLYSHHQQQNDPIERTSSRGMPSVGEEGAEYDNVSGAEQFSKRRSLSPEQTRTIGEDIKLYAPKPSLPALSAKQRVQAVTRTDSDRAAQYGLGRPRSRPTSMHEDPAERTERASSRHSMKKKPSTSFSTHSDAGNGTDDEHGIPQFGHRVPMNPHLGDVQAPSPAPGNDSPGRHHHRKGSSRSLPPGSYGMHGHGVAPQDKLEKAYYQKHPELVEKEQQHHHLHERQNDFAMSSSDLNKLVRETAHRGQGITPEYRSTPTDEVGFQATEEYTSRISSPRPASATPKDNNGLTSPLKQSFQPDPLTPHDEEKAIHVDDARHPEYRSYGDEDTAVDDEDHEYTAPILAADEVQKDPNAYMQRPAVHPVSERRGSSYEAEDPPSRPTSRPSSLYNTVSHEYHNSTPLEDVEEYEPLFTEEEAKAKEKEIQQKKAEARRQHHFPSKDIWEDAPSSVHFTTEVSTPDVPEPKRRKSSAFDAERPQTPAHVFAQQQEERAEKEARAGRPEDWSVRDEDKVYRADSRSPLKHRTNSHGGVASPAHAFAQRQEELAEKEANHGIRPEDWSSQSGVSWRDSRPHLATHRTGGSGKFPSRDIWEDTPESALHVATVSASPPKPDIPARPAKKLSGSSTDRPAIPDRPKPRQDSGDDATKPRPPVSDKPKPQVPVRPVKSSSGDSTEGAAKQKPPVPNRPVGGKIAALQAGFMSDLNKRLKIGPQIPVKKDSEQEEESAAPSAETEKAPLSDARKSRARGPQRRAPAKSPAPAAEAPKQAVPTFTFTMAESSWSIDPEEGNVSVVNASDEKLTDEPAQIEEPLVQALEIKDDGVPGKVDVPEPEAQAEVPVKSDTSEPEVESGIPKSEPAIEPVETEAAATTAQAAEEIAALSTATATDAPPTQMKTLVANTAGESVLETEVENKGEDNIEPVSVQDTPKDL